MYADMSNVHAADEEFNPRIFLADEWGAQNRQALRFSEPHVAALIDPYVTQCTSSELLPLWRVRGVDFEGTNYAPQCFYGPLCGRRGRF